MNNLAPFFDQEPVSGFWGNRAGHPGGLVEGDEGLHRLPNPGGGGGAPEGHGSGLCILYMAAAFVCD